MALPTAQATPRPVSVGRPGLDHLRQAFALAWEQSGARTAGALAGDYLRACAGSSDEHPALVAVAAWAYRLHLATPHAASVTN